MGPEFVRQVAPELALRGWTTPETEAGVTPPENMYDAQTGTPLNWIQDQGGQRMFYVPQGVQATPVRPVGADGLRNRIEEPATVPGLRGPTSDELPPNQALTMRGRLDFEQPRDLLVPPQNPQAQARSGYVGPRATATIPPQRPNLYPRPGAVSPRATARIPSISEGLRNENRSPNVSGIGQENAAETLGDMLSRLNFDIPQLRLNSANAGLRGRANDVRADMPALPEVDVNRDGPFARRRVAGNLAEYPQIGTPQGLAEFNQRMGLNLRSQGRSQAQQDVMRRAGITTATRSWHTQGYAADITPNDLGGLTGQAAVNEVKRRLQAAGYPDMEVIWESGHGRGQGTGAHVHIEPMGSMPQ